MDMDKSGDCWGAGDIRELNGDVKNAIKFFFKDKKCVREDVEKRESLRTVGGNVPFSKN